MTRPRVERDRLMFDPSLRRSPAAPVLEARSEPAKSTKESLEALYWLNDCIEKTSTLIERKNDSNDMPIKAFSEIFKISSDKLCVFQVETFNK